MLLKLLESLVIGVSIAAIPGPIFFELIRRTLFNGLYSGIFLVIGEFCGNFLLLTLIYFGASHLFLHTFAKVILYCIGGCVLLVISNSAFRLKPKIVEESYKDVDNEISKKSFLAGFSIAATSPIVITLWISLSGSYLAAISNKQLAFANVFLIAFGFLLFFIPLAFIVHKTRHVISSKHVLLLSRAFGVVLMGYGVLLFVNALKLALT